MDSVSKLLPDVQKQYHKTAGTKIQLNVQDQPVILELPQQGKDDVSESFLWLLLQVPTNLVAYKDAHLSSYSSGGQNSKTSCPGLKPR